MSLENGIIVINKTRLEQLIERFNTKSQAKFYIEHSGGDFRDYELEHDTFCKALEKVRNEVAKYLKVKILERKYITNFLFSKQDAVIVIGQDGLVANTAKYVGNIPILGINPDIQRFDGVLLPFNTQDFFVGLQNLIDDRVTVKTITMAEAKMNDGQKLTAFNDFFIGPSSHVSARYKISFGKHVENHSSSGIIVSTGAGATGWLSSIVNMTNGLQTTFNRQKSNLQVKMNWDEDRLVFVVREPFASKYSQANITGGIINNEHKLVLESFMPTNGIVFSDGIETDYMTFNSGSIVEVGLSPQKAAIIRNK
jgi:NAD kinase